MVCSMGCAVLGQFLQGAGNILEASGGTFATFSAMLSAIGTSFLQNEIFFKVIAFRHSTLWYKLTGIPLVHFSSEF